jgi:class 3 adenylate cyclase
MRENEELGRERHLVVVFDICSSTTILEDLKRTDNLAAWRDLLLDMKAHLQQEGSRLAMCLYKFIGDGWVLLFPDNVPKKELCGLLCRLSEWYQAQFERSIRPLLLQEPSPIGLMFGIDAGELIRLELDEQDEYLGRAINVASRLQTQTKELRGGPSYKAIFSRNSFNSPAPPPRDLAVESTKVSLRNISPSTIECFIFQTLQPPAEKQATSRVPRLETAAKPPKPATQAHRIPPVPPAAPESVAPGSLIRVTDLRPTRISPISELGKWTWHDEGQEGAVIQFRHEPQKAPGANKNVVAKALLIYRADGQEVLRIHGSWLDGHDQAKLNASDSRGLIVGVRGSNGFFALETVRTSVGGTERVEIRPARFAPVPAKLTVLVQLTDAKGQDLLYEGDFAIGTNPLTIAPL